MSWSLRHGQGVWESNRPWVMGIVNITPDSFSDGGRYLDPERAVEHALRLVDEGADILDLGAESTRPGSLPVPVEEELGRLLPVIRAIRLQTDIPLSVDTSQPEVMRQAAAEGVDLLNDVRALTLPGALEVAAQTGLAVCLMHMQGQPLHMQNTPEYAEVRQDVKSFLQGRVQVCLEAGIESRCLCVDPGFGFGKSLEHNLALMAHLSDLRQLGPVLVGVSRKSMLGAALGGRPVQERMPAGLAAALWAATQGAAILRTHDVQATCDALRIWRLIEEQKS